MRLRDIEQGDNFDFLGGVRGLCAEVFEIFAEINELHVNVQPQEVVRPAAPHVGIGRVTRITGLPIDVTVARCGKITASNIQSITTCWCDGWEHAEYRRSLVHLKFNTEF